METKKKLKRSPKPLWFVLGVCLLGLVAASDYAVGPTLSLTVFFLVPIVLLTWFVGLWAGVTGVALSGAYWFAEGVFLRPEGGGSFTLPAWNGALELGLFLVVAYLLRALRSALDREKQFARTDSQTGALNARAFREMAEQEIRRCSRYEKPFTAAYLDLDDFKSINDRFGHAVGDQVLGAVAEIVKRNTRGSDIFARLGGDEFAVLLPECGMESAFAVLTRIQQRLTEAMGAGGWPVTFSIGAITYNLPPGSYDQLVRETDALMYQVKSSGKNALRHNLAPGSLAPQPAS